MATLQSTESFSDGNVLYASALTNHVVAATPLPDFIAGQDPLNDPAGVDQLLINDISDGAVKRVTVSTLAQHLPATIVASLEVSGGTTVEGNATFNGNTTIGSEDTDTLTVNAATTIGASATFDGAITANDNVTLGELAESGTYSRLDATMTITKVDHGLATDDIRWFNIENNQDYLGYYTVTVLTDDTFSITVVDDEDAPTTGTVYWYAKTTTLESPLAGAISGTPAVSLLSTTDAYGDKVLIQDASDTDKLKVVAACLPKAWACVSIKTADTTTVTATVSRTAGSNIATVTKTSHGFKVGDVLYLQNGVANAWYDIKSVPDANTFTIQTVATTALSSVSTQWYALTVNGFNISSAFKKDATDHVAMFNLATPMASVNYAIIATFSRDDGVAYGATCCNVIGFSNFDKTTKQFSITSNYASNVENDGSVMLTVFGNI